MKELTFLHKNAERWKTFEESLKAGVKLDSDELANLFTQVLEDLSYAQTFYPGSDTTRYLQGLSAQAHNLIYKNKRAEKGRFWAFWKEELPTLIRSAHKEIAYSLIIFLLAGMIGAISARHDDGFVRLILGDAYVNMTLENMQQGDPMGVYKKMQQLDMFLVITVNNIRVSFLAFAMGALFSFGTGYILFSNGVMFGSFQYYFYQKGFLLDSLLTIYIHGALELSAIVIAGGAGIVMGNSLLFPGTYSRLESFVRGARKGALIVVGLVPIFITAGFLEGFVTRQTDMPVPLSLLIILGSFAFMIWYFVMYPIALERRKKDD